METVTHEGMSTVMNKSITRGEEFVVDYCKTQGEEKERRGNLTTWACELDRLNIVLA
jgi:hypothetical protein